MRYVAPVLDPKGIDTLLSLIQLKMQSCGLTVNFQLRVTLLALFCYAKVKALVT